MAGRYDIESLRSEGIQAVANSQNYTTAAIRGNGKSPVTITNPDLTANERQLFDWYDMDAGMDLDALGADLELFKGAVTTMKSAAERQHGQLQQLMGMWEGKGSEAANQFLRTHNSTADAVTGEFGKVSTGLDGLREALWNIVDLKKQATTMVDGLVTDRASFDSAVATYKTGTGDKSVADETNATKIGPHVQQNIEGKWLPAMKTAWAKGGEAYDTLINGLKQELPPEFKSPPGQFGPEYDADNNPETKPKDKDRKGKSEAPRGSDTGGAQSGGDSGSAGGTASGGMQGTATPASALGNQGGQMSGVGQQQGAGQGQGQQGMDPSQIVSGLTGAMTGALGSIGQAASGIVSAITEGLSNIPFDQMGQGGEPGPDDKIDGKADEAADKVDDKTDKKDPDTKMAAAKDAAIQEARTDAGATFATDGKPAPTSGVQLAGAGGLEAAPAPAGQTTPGAPFGTTPPGTVPPPGMPAQPAGATAPVNPPPVQAQQPTPTAHPEPQPAAAPQPSPLPSAGPASPSAKAQAAGTETGETPCEIAADELPKAGR
ncbi:hypothetical protein [Mycobacteroides saopaulense]|uniref:Uncharacterized protein n=1 Tax=Mycobacteroides saopaulense TaxID=1578165 RepID=A0ABX3C503_9MYCO|nr:hypothetical protein [Mycobacteroides saopaulense]OHT88814.1 hypothetical protein BKG68_02715 [Mycobacteroides saopaulense]OHU13634.1 hypothetical protein BKG73_02720 [Mycobacteroides saopaulense]